LALAIKVFSPRDILVSYVKKPLSQGPKSGKMRIKILIG